MPVVPQTQAWPVNTNIPTLRPDEIHLWLIPTDLPAAVQNHAYQNLDTDEKNRADRFRVEHARQQHIIAHATLRTLLSAYQEIPPDELRFEKGERGKPALVTTHHAEPLHFNLSHSGNYALLGLCRNHPLGVDIEQKKEIRDARGLINRFFTQMEAREFECLDGDKLINRFYRLWTCKEALLKAEGQGITGGLDSFAISLEAEIPLTTVWQKVSNAHIWANPDWMLKELVIPNQYAGAVACYAGIREINCFTADIGKII